jgi:hypothetical protein
VYGTISSTINATISGTLNATISNTKLGAISSTINATISSTINATISNTKRGTISNTINATDRQEGKENQRKKEWKIVKSSKRIKPRKEGNERKIVGLCSVNLSN